jgi:hypothetical protein
MKAISELLTLFEDFFLVSETITEGNVLQSILMHLLILKRLTLFPLFKSLLGNLLTSS